MNAGNGAVTSSEGLEIRREGGISTSGTPRGRAVLLQAVGGHLRQLLALTPMRTLTPCRPSHCTSPLLLEPQVPWLPPTSTFSPRETPSVRRAHWKPAVRESGSRSSHAVRSGRWDKYGTEDSRVMRHVSCDQRQRTLLVAAQQAARCSHSHQLSLLPPLVLQVRSSGQR